MRSLGDNHIICGRILKNYPEAELARGLFEEEFHEKIKRIATRERTYSSAIS